MELNIHRAEIFNGEIYYRIFDLSAKEVVIDKKLNFNRKISVDNLSPGFYILLLKMEEAFFLVKFVKVD